MISTGVNMEIDDAGVREMRRLLRQVQEHLFLSHVDLGARRETVGWVELVYHPANAVPDLNYIAPRRKTAWVSGHNLQQGLDRMASLERTPCVRYIEGLYPPLFAKALGEFGLEAQQETPIMLYKAGGIQSLGLVLPSPALSAHEDIRVSIVQDELGAELWWEFWRNGLYDVIAPGIEPLIRWRQNGSPVGQQVDIMIYRQKSLVGVARVSLQPQNQSSQITALALLQEMRSADLTQTLLAAALHQALARGCDLVFAPGDSDDLRALYRDLGFIDVGSLVSYSQRAPVANEGTDDGGVAQPVLTTL